MKSIPSANILSDPIKRQLIDQLLHDAKMDLSSYAVNVNNSTIKETYVLTNQAFEEFLRPENRILMNYLKQKYPVRFVEGTYCFLNHERHSLI